MDKNRQRSITNMSAMSGSMGTSQKSSLNKAGTSKLGEDEQANSPTDFQIKGKRASAPILEEIQRENDSKVQQRVTLSPQDGAARASMLTTYSNENTINEILNKLEEITNLIQVQEWYNIPKPVKATCEGIIDFQKVMVHSILFNAETARKKSIQVQDKLKKLEHKVTQGFEDMNSKIDKHVKSINEKARNHADSVRQQFQAHGEANYTLKGQIVNMQGVLEVWDGKMRRMDSKMISLSETALLLETSGENQKKEFSKVTVELAEMLLVPNVVGPELEMNPYKNIKEFITATHDLNQSSTAKLEKALKVEGKRTQKLIADLKEDMMDYMRLQETEISNLRAKVNQIDEEMEGLMKDENNEEEEENEEDAEDLLEDAHSQENRRSQSSGEDEFIKQKASQNSDSENQRENNLGLTIAIDRENVCDQVSEPAESTKSQIKQTFQSVKKQSTVLSSESRSRTDKSLKSPVKFELNRFATSDSVNQGFTHDSFGQDPAITGRHNQIEESESQTGEFQQTFRRVQPSKLIDHQTSFYSQTSQSEVKTATIIKGLTKKNTIKKEQGSQGPNQDQINMVLNEETSCGKKIQITKLASDLNQAEQITESSQPNVSYLSCSLKETSADKIMKDQISKQPSQSQMSRASSSMSKNPGKREKNNKLGVSMAKGKEGRRVSVKKEGLGKKAQKANIHGTPAPEGFAKWMDEVINHSIRFEEKTTGQIDAITQMITAFSKVMWVQHREVEALYSANKQSRLLQEDHRIDEESSPSSSSSSSSDSKSRQKGKKQTPPITTKAKSVQMPQKPPQIKPKHQSAQPIGMSETSVQVKEKLSGIIGLDAASLIEEEVKSFYSQEIAMKHHFVEAYLNKLKDDAVLSELLSLKPRGQSHMRKLLSSNLDEALLKAITSLGNQAAQFELNKGNKSLHQEVDRMSLKDRKEPLFGTSTNVLQQSSVGNEKFNTEGASHQRNPRYETAQTNGVDSTNSKPGSARPGSMRREKINNCPKCRGTGENRPCEEWVQILRKEFGDQINELFRVKMKEFIDFIEESLDVDEQIDVENDNVIHAFYREHNTLQKMHENFRLLEYKRKKYLQERKDKKSQSPQRSPPHGTIHVPTQKNFLTSLYQSSDLKRPKNNNPSLRNNFEEFEIFGRSSELPNRNNPIYQSTQVSNLNSTQISKQVSNQGSSEMRRGSAKQSSQPSMRNQNQQNSTQRTTGNVWNQTNTLLNHLHPTIDITSSGATHRAIQKNRYPTSEQEKLPIISTRKAHLTIDQKVWDADHQSRNFFKGDLTNVATLRNALFNTSTDRLGSENEASQIINGPIDVKITSLNTGIIDRQKLSIINQDSSQNMTPALGSIALASHKSTQKRSPVPLIVQFQELVHRKNP